MPTSRYSILILEDSPEDRSLYCRYLNEDIRATYDVVEMETGLEALTHLAQNKPDLILLDYELPDVDGLEFLKQLQLRFDSLQIPVIMLTGIGDEKIAAQAIKGGAADYLVKGKLTSAGLCQTVHSTLEKNFLKQELQLQEQQQLLLARILLRIRQFLRLEEILSTAVREVREFLKADRVIVYQFDPQMNGKIVAESVLPEWTSSLNSQIHDTCFRENQGIAYRDGKIRAISDISNAGLTPCHIALLEEFEVKANLIVPILLNTQPTDLEASTHQLWGLLIAHQCSTTREWEKDELDLLQQLSVELAVAIQQAQLYENLQNLNASLEQKVQERTKELQASEQRFRAIFNNTFHFTGLLTTEGILLEANETALKFGGLRLEDVINRPFWEAYWWTISQATQDRLKQAIALAAQGEFIRYEVDIFGAGRQIATIDFSIRPLKDESGQVVMLIPEGRDISERKQAEATLQLQAQILNEIHDAVVSTDINGIIQTWNQGAEKLYGYTAAEVIGQNLSILYEDPTHLQTEVIAPLIAKGSHEVEIASRAKSGDRVYVNLRLSIIRDEEGNIIRLIGCSNDISKRKQAQKALQENQILLQVVMDSLPIAIFWKDRNSRYLGCNRQLLLDGGLSSSAEIIGKTDFDMVWREQAPLYQLDDRIVMESGQAKFNIEEPFTKHGNIDRWLRTNKIPLHNSDGEIIGVLASYEDITERKQIEQALQASERRYATLAASAPVGIFRTDAQGNCLYVNDRWCEIAGLTPKEALGCGWVKALHPEYREMVLTHWYRCIQTDETLCLEYQFQRPDGLETWVFGQAVAEKNLDGTIIGYVGTITDITSLKQAEEQRDQLLQILESQNQTLEAQVMQRTAKLQSAELQLRNLSYRLRLAVKSAKIGIWDLDLIKNSLVWDERMYELFGVSPMNFDPSQGAWEKFEQLIHPDDRVAVREAVQEVIAKDQELDTEFRIILPNGTTRILQAYALLQRNSQGQPQRLIGINYDISDRKLAQAEILRSRDLREAIFNESADALFLVNVDTLRTIDCNQRAVQMFAATDKTELIDIEGHQLQKQQFTPEEMQAITDEINQQGFWSQELEYNTFTGESFWGNLAINQITVAGQKMNLVRVTDISQRKLAESQLQQTNKQLIASNAELARATRLKDEFLANMSHELRTPLNAILGISEALQDEAFGVINGKQRQSLQTIERSGNHLLTLINDILDLSKIEAGQMELDYSQIAISSLCQSTLAFIKQQAFQKGIQLLVNIQPHLPVLRLDERRIRQVLINLLNNAVKFTPEGGRITLDVTRQKIALGDCIRIAVMDTGIGIAPENLHKLFQPFVQIDSTLNRKYAGTGLGLALVKRIVEIHGGQVGVSSELGVGSCFTVDLPCAQLCEFLPESVNQVSPQLNSTLKETAEHSPLILLAEDNEATIFTISNYLEAIDYQIILANNGQEAIALLKTQVPDLILMDIQMPDVDGLEAIKQIRLDQNCVNIPIIALTALAMPGDEEKCLAAGANHYLTKPVKLKQLASIIQQVLAVKDK